MRTRYHFLDAQKRWMVSLRLQAVAVLILALGADTGVAQDLGATMLLALPAVLYHCLTALFPIGL